MYKYCSCIFLVKIRDNAIYAVSRNEHAMPGSCVILSSLSLKKYIRLSACQLFQKRKKETNFFI